MGSWPSKLTHKVAFKLYHKLTRNSVWFLTLSIITIIQLLPLPIKITGNTEILSESLGKVSLACSIVLMRNIVL